MRNLFTPRLGTFKLLALTKQCSAEDREALLVYIGRLEQSEEFMINKINNFATSLRLEPPLETDPYANSQAPEASRV